MRWVTVEASSVMDEGLEWRKYEIEGNVEESIGLEVGSWEGEA